MRMFKALFFTCAGLLLLAAAWVTESHVRDFVRTAESVPGTIACLDHGPFHVEVTFTTARGETLTRSMSGFWGARMGQPVRVLYSRSAPAHSATLDVASSLHFAPLLLLVLGALFTLTGAGLLRPDRVR